MICIAVDDEPLALQIIEDYIQKISFLELKGTFTNAIEATNYINNHTIDLVFLDIQMPNLTGIEFIKSLVQPPMIIFTTAYNKYAMQGYELNVIDYLLKPFSFERFFQAVNKSQELFKLKENNKYNQAVLRQNDFLLVKEDYQTIKINFENILYIESMADYIRIVTPGKKHTVLATMKSIDNLLPNSGFIRVHRSYIIALSKIISFNKKSISIGDMHVPIGDSYRDDFMNFMQDRTIG